MNDEQNRNNQETTYSYCLSYSMLNIKRYSKNRLEILEN